MTRKSKIAYDIVFVLDGTNSIQSVFQVLKEEVVDRAMSLRLMDKEIIGHHGVVIYRDPVDNPGDPKDVHEYLQLTSNFEAVEAYLEHVECYGGRDGPEDWVGGLDLALHKMNWRNVKKCIFWVADENAHGSRFSNERRDRHDDQADLLIRLIQEVARRHIYFALVNVRAFDDDPGCAKTAAILRDIYQAAGGPGFSIVDFKCDWNVDEWTGEGWSPQTLDAFHETIRGTLRREQDALIGLGKR
jgi:hypothetical protein